jgi:hypothetical protein
MSRAALSLSSPVMESRRSTGMPAERLAESWRIRRSPPEQGSLPLNATGFRCLGVVVRFDGLVTAGSFLSGWSGRGVGHGDDGGRDAGAGVLPGGPGEAAG